MDPARWRVIEKVFDGAIDLPPEQRSRYLDSACAGDGDLRAEVESLLAAHAEAREYLEVPAASLKAVRAAYYRPGHEIGPYRLVRELGRGGLGLVYLAEDTRLGRQVALKLLPWPRAADVQARARFQREARAASALDHPNICSIYELGESGAGDPYIAMAHVPGESLRERIARGPLPVSQAVDIATQTALGLAYAHDRGIVHRDVKPANLMVTPDGQVKIVDFGLAKGRGAPTLTRAGTTPGTVAYMSPEQIRGGTVDHRTDIWALGVVLYEMITGQTPFRGDDDQSRMFAILNQDVEPLTALRAGVPLALEPVLAKVLAKDPERRYQHVDELPVDLTSAMKEGAGVARRTAGWDARTAGPRGLIPLLIGAALGISLTILVGNLRGPDDPPPPSAAHLSVALPADQELVGAVFRRFALSPDGEILVYAARENGRQRLYARRLDGDDARPIPGTENAIDPFFSPDGRWVGFFAGDELRKVSLAGGDPLRICDAPTDRSRGASWGSDGTIILPLGQVSGLFRVSAAGGTPEPLTVPDGDFEATGHFFPQILPGGQSVLFTIWSGGEWSTAILRLDTGEWEEVTQGCAAARYVATGHVLCAQMAGILPTGTLVASRLEPGRPARSGPSVSLSGSTGLGEFDFAIASSGTLVYATGTSRGGRTVAVSVDRAGRAAQLEGNGEGYLTPSLSPDGTRAAVTRIVGAGREELWLLDLENRTSARLSASSVIDNLPIWSPDGERILFNSVRAPPGLYEVSPDLGGAVSLLLPRGKHILAPASFSPDGRMLAYTELNSRTLGDLWTLSLDDGVAAPLLVSPANERSPVFSPDGRWLAFTADESGIDQVYVQAYPGPGPSLQVSTDGGAEPLWSADGTELFYRHANAMMAVPVSMEGAFTAGRPIRLFEDRYAKEYKGRANYDVGPDGRFLMVRVEEESERLRLDVILNWFGELERLLPAPESDG